MSRDSPTIIGHFFKYKKRIICREFRIFEVFEEVPHSPGLISTRVQEAAVYYEELNQYVYFNSKNYILKEGAGFSWTNNGNNVYLVHHFDRKSCLFYDRTFSSDQRSISTFYDCFISVFSWNNKLISQFSSVFVKLMACRI